MTDFVAGTTPTLQITFLDRRTKEPIPLTTATVTLRFKVGYGAVLERAMTVTDAANGIAQYTFIASEFLAGELSYEARVVDTGDIFVTEEIETLQVREPLL